MGESDGGRDGKARKAARLIEVARLANVSRATAARALGGYGVVTQDTQRKVAEAAQALDYRVNDLARSMRSGKTLTIGVVVADISNSFTLNSIRGIIDASASAGYQSLVLNTDGDVQREREAIRVLREKRVDGLLVVPASHLEVDHLAGGRGHGAPVVLFDRFIDDLALDSVITADFEASRAAINLFVDHGHRRIGLLLGTAAHHGHQAGEPPDTVSAVRERARGAMAGFADAGLAVNPAWVRYAGSVAPMALAAARHLLAQSPRPTAILAGNEEMLLGALAAAEEIDLTIGRDLSLISFDDAPWLAVFRPPLSVVQRPTYELGRQAVSLLLSKVGGNRKSGSIVLPATLVNRASVARIGS
ncbi:MAG: LacI family transcriptional regulator [Proteobacteria bacterium]|nr:LacI family transcriptional regulator [Pseudomonadota bacterium]